MVFIRFQPLWSAEMVSSLLNQGGSLPEEAFPKLIDHVKGLDMDEIREEIAKDEDDE